MTDEAKGTDQDLVDAALGSPSVAIGKRVEFNGRTYEIRRATLAQQRRIDEVGKRKDGTDDTNLKLVHGIIESVYNPQTGKRIFTRKHEESLLAQSAGPGTFLHAFMKAFKELADEEADIEKNSDAAPTDKQS